MRVEALPLPAGQIEGVGLRESPGAGGQTEGGFGQWLARALDNVNGLQVGADRAAERLATGQAESLHETVLALERASLALELTVQVTKKAVEACQEIQRLQV